MAKSMALNQAAGLSGMLKSGHKHFEGIHGAILRNIDAVKELSTIVQTSLGPNGMNKLLINHLEKVFVTSDCATIIKELEVAHPAAKIVALAAETQESEFGDNTNFVVSFAGELLKNAEELIKNGIHTSEIVSGYQKAFEKVMEIIPNLVVSNLENVKDQNELAKYIKSVLSTKYYDYDSLLSKLVAEACIVTLSPTAKKPLLNTDSVRIAKLQGGNVALSSVIKGMVILRDSEGIIKKVEKSKVVVFGCGFEATSSEAKGTVLIKNAEELMSYNKSEEAKLEEIVASVAASGVKLVVCNGSISEMALHFLNKYELMVMKIQSKFELRRICGVLGATPLMRLGAPTPEEMGECTIVEVREIGGKRVLLLDQAQAEDTSVATILLRAATEHIINDLERAVDDGISAVKALCIDGRVLPGAGAVELELSKRLKEYADEISTLDQYAIRKFGDSFDVVPRQLAVNSGCDATNMLHTLHLSHSNGNGCNMGFHIDEQIPIDSTLANIYDIYTTKVNAIRLAVDAAITVLKVDQIVMSKPAGGPKVKQPGPDQD